MARILVVEDDGPMAEGLEYNLARAGHEVLVARDGRAGLERALAERPDLVVLDLMLPSLDGFGFLERFRERASGVPVIVLSALGDERTKVRGLDAGAADYVTKPFGVAELLARIRARLAEHPASSAVVRIGHGEADLARHEYRAGPLRVALTPTEVALLTLLARRPAVAVTREEIVRSLWGVETAATRTLDTHVARLRKKIERDPARPEHLVTVHGVGLRLDP